MPLFEVPPEAETSSTQEETDATGTAGPEREPTPGRRMPRFARLRNSGRTTNLDVMERSQLISLIEELEEKRRRDRLIWLVVFSVLFHLALLLGYTYIPVYLLHRPRVVNPSDVMAKNPQNFQFLDLPPDALKHIPKPKTNILSDQDRRAQTQHPTLDKKTLAQLEAMKPAGPPAPQQRPSPQQQANPQPQQQPAAPQPQTQQPQQAQQQPLRPSPLTPAPQQQANNTLPSNPQPDFRSMMKGTPRDSINSAARGAEGSSGGMSGGGAPSRHPGINSGMEILSDTLGVDFGPYMARLKFLIERSWWPLIPESARPPLNKQGVVQIRFVILPDGTLQPQGMRLDGRSGDVALDRAAWAGITGAAPLPPLPKEYLARGAKNLEIRGAFLYNLTPDQLH